MSTIALLVVAVLLPTAAGGAWVAARRGYESYRRSRPAAATDRPIAGLTADLRRLHDLLEDTENASGLPSKHLRCTATRAAYVDALTQACRQLAVREPVRPVSRAEIYRVESDLRRCGLDVRPVA